MLTFERWRGDVPPELYARLREDGAALLRRLADNASLLAIAQSLGPIMVPGVAMDPNLHDGLIYSVQPRNAGAGARDNYGNTILSTTNLRFVLHTDAYNSAEPPRFVLLMRTDAGEQDEEPTKSYVSDGDQALVRMPSRQLDLLKQPRFPSARGSVALVEMYEDQRRLRFNPEEIARWGDKPDPPIAAALNLLTELLIDGQEEFVLEPGDCLVLDNWRTVHGRSEIPAGSPRRLSRVWVASG